LDFVGPTLRKPTERKAIIKDNTILEPRFKPNYLFYTNQINSKPDGGTINAIHKNWYGDFNKLESHHGYIQWLFPLFKNSAFNSLSVPLDHDEAKLMRQSSIVAKRFVNSYELILNFFGMELNNKTGAVRRHSDEKFWKERYTNLERNGHNLLRISRIITSLGHFGFHSWRKPFLDFLTTEIMVNDHFGESAKKSLHDHWLPLLNVDSAEFISKTDETAADREDSIYFKILKEESNGDTDEDSADDTTDSKDKTKEDVDMKEKQKVKDSEI